MVGVVLVVCLLISPTRPVAHELPKSTAAGPKIVTTTALWADLVTGVTCDDQANVKTLMPSGADPHGYQPSLADRAVLEGADLVVMNGLLEEGLQVMIRSVEEVGTEVFRSTDHVETLSFNGDHGHIGVDPHVWMDPVRVSEVLPKLTKRIIEVGRLNPTTLQACLDRTQAVLAEVDAEIRELVAGVPEASRMLVTNHASLSYFADRYGFEVIGNIIPATSTLAAVSPAHLEQLGERMKASGASVIFVEAGQASADAKALAKHVGGVRVVEIFTGGLPENDPWVTGYVEVLRTNARLITEALLGESDNSKHDEHGRSHDENSRAVLSPE